MKHLYDIATMALEAAKSAGADGADAVLIEQRSLEAQIREGAIEHIERSEAHDLGLRVFVGKSQAIVASSKLDTAAVSEAAQRAVDMARVAPEDPHAGLARRDELASNIPDLDLWDESEVEERQLVALAKQAEEEALAVKGVSKSSGAEASAGARQMVLATSEGFLKGYRRSGFGFSIAVIAGEGTAMERDYDFSSAVHYKDLAPAKTVGARAGERAVKRLHPRKIASQRVPVVYDRRIAASLIGHFASAISGPAVARGTSFLKDMMGQEVFSRSITIIDDPLMRRGLGSRPFDAEGLAVAGKEIVMGGVLKGFLLDLSSARQLGLAPSGHASRGTGSPPSPSPSNLYLGNGTSTPEELIADIGSGFYVSELLGMGVNGVTGDYSRGASGFWIENGRISYPVSEVTIAGNLKEMYRRLTPANDLEFRMTMNAPTCRVEGMTVAGA